MQMQIITHMSTMNSLSTALLSILRLTALPTMPPPTPPSIISPSDSGVNGGTVPLTRLTTRFVIWLKRMIYSELETDFFVSMLKK